MQYVVHTVQMDDLPAGVEAVIAERTDAPPVLILAGAAARLWTWLRAWEDAHEAASEPSIILRSVG